MSRYNVSQQCTYFYHEFLKNFLYSEGKSDKQITTRYSILSILKVNKISTDFSSNIPLSTFLVFIIISCIMQSNRMEENCN